MSLQSSYFKRPFVAGAVTVLSLSLSMAIFWELQNVEPDIGSHRIHIISVRNGDADWPPNFLYYVLVAWLGALIGDPTQLVVTTSIFLTLCVCAKALITQKIFESLAPRASSPALLIGVLAILFAFAVPWPLIFGATTNYLLGSLTPNVWHNSTTIFLTPFALAIFILQAKAFE